MQIRPLKVLQVLPHLGAGGVPQGCVDMAKALNQQGIESYIISAGGTRQQEVVEANSHHITLPVDTKNPFKMILNTYRLVIIIRQLGINIIHARSRAPAWSCLLAAELTKIPFVTTFHGTYNFNNICKKFYNSVMARGNGIIAISKFIHKHMLMHYSTFCAVTKIELIYRGIDVNYFSYAKVTADNIKVTRSQWQVKAAQMVLLMPARLTRWKGQNIVIEALNKIPRDQFKCIFVGSDQGRKQYKEKLLTLIQSYNLQDNILFIENGVNMPLLYASCDMVIHASSDPEAFGRTVAEAQAMGKPVIASSLGAPREIIIQDVTGWLFSPDNPQQLADHLEYHYALKQKQGDDYFKEQASLARNNIMQNFSLTQMTSKTIALYYNLVSSYP